MADESTKFSYRRLFSLRSTRPGSSWAGLGFRIVAVTVSLALYASLLHPAPPGSGAVVDLDSKATPISASELTPSGAHPLYPENHTLDGADNVVGGPVNADFEEPSQEVGTPPANYDLQADPALQVAVPNGDFETGNFTDWTVEGAPTIRSDETRGYWARLGASGDRVISKALSLPADANALTYEVGHLNLSGHSILDVYVMSGEDFSTVTRIHRDDCSGCGTWATTRLDISAYAGQTVKFYFRRAYGVKGLDDVRIEQPFAGFPVAGAFWRVTEPDGNVYARLGRNGRLTSPAFTVDEDADDGEFGFFRTSNAQYKVWVATGPEFSSWSEVTTTGNVAGTWTTLRFDLVPYRGQDIKVRIGSTYLYGWIGVDDFPVQVLPAPGWETPSGGTSWLREENGNHHIETRARLVSSPFQVTSEADHITLRLRSNDWVALYVELRRGPNFSEVISLDYRQVHGEWVQLAYQVGNYQGETVRLQVRRYVGQWLHVDDAGVLKEVVPAWRFLSNSSNSLTVGEDPFGTYVSPRGLNVTARLRSRVVAGLDDETAAIRYHSVTYAVGEGGGTLYVDWLEGTGSSSTQIFFTSQKTETRQRYFTISRSLPTPGRLQLRISGDVRVYAVSDNLARTHLSEPYSRKVGHGIDTSTGALSYQETDVTIPGAFPIAFTRFYRAHSARRTPLGGHWSHTYDAYLTFGPSGSVGVVYGSAREEFFLRNADGTYRPFESRVQSNLVKNTDGSYTLTTRDRLVYAFSSAGRLESIIDPNDNTLSLTYDAEDRLTQVTGPGNAALGLAYDDDGNLTSLTDPEGAIFAYAYDDNGNVVSVTHPEGATRTYTYDRQRLTKVTDEDGRRALKNTYDGAHRVIRQVDAGDAAITLSHEDPGRGATTVTDPEGATSLFYFDANLRTTNVVDPQGRVVSYFFDAAGHLKSFLDPDGNAWALAWDEAGNLTSTSDPLGNPINFTYNAERLPTSITDGRGNTTTFTYDSKGNLATSTDPLGSTWSYTYDSAGNVLTETDPLGNTTTSTYNAKGNKLTETDPLGNTTTYTYDSAGRLRSETDPEGNRTRYFYDLLGRLIVIEDPDLAVNSFLYGPAGHLLRVDDPLGNTTTWSYDERGLVKTKTDTAGKQWSYEYDGNHRMTAMTDPLGNTTAYAYHPDGNLASITNAEGATTSYSYDSSGRLTRELDPLNRATTYVYDEAGRLLEQIAPNGGRVTYAYDEVGNLVSQANALGHTVTHAYDAANRLTATTDPRGNQTLYAHDAAGRLVSVTDPEGGVTLNSYDAASRLVSTTDPAGAETTYAHDGAGQLTEVTDATGRATAYAYDPAGRMASVTDAGGNTSSYAYDAAGRLTTATSAEGRTTTYSYDPRGLLLTEKDALENTTAYAYDAAGRRTKVTDPRGNATEFTHDAAGRVTGITDALGGTVSFAYDAAGQRTALTDPRGKTWTYTYDLLGNLATETDPLARTWSYDYDASGKREKRLDPKGQEVTHAYDASGALTGVTNPEGETTYAYDAAGRRTAMTDTHGTTNWSYDATGRVAEVASPEGTLTYGYDAAGRRTAMGLPGQRQVTYSYDAAGRTKKLTDWSQREVAFAYDDDGNRVKITRPNGVDTDFSYDGAGRLDAVSHTDGISPLLEFAYTLDAAGNRTAVSGTRGTETYVLDELNRITQVTYADGTVVEYDYDAAGNRISETVDGVTTTYTYDDASQLVSVGTEAYSYDDNGNLVSAGENSFAWDWDNRLIAANVSGTTASYAYDGDGVRVSSSAGSESRSELSDREAGLPTIVDDGTESYLHADGLIASIDASGDPTYAHADGLRSIRGRSDALGAMIGTTDYEIFGAPRAESGVQGFYGFTGEPQDATGLVHLRARTHDPATGRFLSPDAVRPGAPGTGGYHLYTYVANNPTTWIDPSGHTAVGLDRYLPLLLVGMVTAAMGGGGITLGMWVVIGFLMCASLPGCNRLLSSLMQTAVSAGVDATVGAVEWTIEQLQGLVTGEVAHPAEVKPVEVPIPWAGSKARTETRTRSRARSRRGCDKGLLPPTPDRIDYVNNRHRHGANKGKSEFHLGIEWQLLVAYSAKFPSYPSTMPVGMCLRRINFVPLTIGRDVTRGNAETSILTVVSEKSGKFWNAYPGEPAGFIGPKL
jgi:RHS repeat-associated protein